MRALSIRQPWAWLIVNGYKDIEKPELGHPIPGSGVRPCRTAHNPG